MKKLLIGSSFFLLLISFSLVGYQMVSAKNRVDEIPDQLVVQEKLEEYLTPYGYTIENPNVILNPYGISPLTAIILFETEQEEEVTITIEGVDDNSTYKNTFEATRKHSIPIYGLYPDKINKIHIDCGKLSKIIEIKTEPLPHDLKPKISENHNNHLFFVTSDKYPYAVDNNQEVRWYLTKKYSGKIDRMINGNLLLSLDSYYDHNYSSGVVEIDLLGKIYKQYNLNHGYYGSYVETDTSLFLLSDNILEFDKQSGVILNTIFLDKVYDKISYDKEQNRLIVSNSMEAIQIDLDTKKKSAISLENKINNEQEIVLPVYYSPENYKFIKGIKYTNVEETPIDHKNILLVGYQNIDSNYKKYQVKITKSADNLQVSGNFLGKEVYLIMDQFMDKRVYDIKDNQITVNKEGLSGKYSIYIKIDNTIYKTNTFIEF